MVLLTAYTRSTPSPGAPTRLYLDTADRAAAEDLLRTGLFAGLTTNPTILQRSGLGVADAPEVHRWAVAAGAREVYPVEEAHSWRLGRIEDPFGHHWEIGRPLVPWPPARGGP